MALKKAIDNHKPFLDNKYSKWYMELVSKDCNDDYVERHHILPKSLYPEYAKCKWNIVKLSARKHLTEEYRNKLKQHAIKQWQEVKASGYTNKSKNNRIQSCL